MICPIKEWSQSDCVDLEEPLVGSPKANWSWVRDSDNIYDE